MPAFATIPMSDVELGTETEIMAVELENEVRQAGIFAV